MHALLLLLLCSIEWGGSNIRPEATGYGAVYFGEQILNDLNDNYEVRSDALCCCCLVCLPAAGGGGFVAAGSVQHGPCPCMHAHL